MSQKHLQQIVTCAFCVCAVAYGALFSVKSWDGMIYFYTSSNERNPAAIRRIFDFSHLEGRDLMMASQERLLSDARVVHQGNDVGVELGHFVSRSPNGNKEFACRTYDRIELRFTSAQMATAGVPASMVVKGPCVIAKDINRIAPIWIPTEKVLGQKAGDVELQFMEDHSISLKFDNIGDEWPTSWNLDSVRLYSSQHPGHEVAVDRFQLEKLSKNPIVVAWGSARKPATQK